MTCLKKAELAQLKKIINIYMKCFITILQSSNDTYRDAHNMFSGVFPDLPHDIVLDINMEFGGPCELTFTHPKWVDVAGKSIYIQAGFNTLGQLEIKRRGNRAKEIPETIISNIYDCLWLIQHFASDIIPKLEKNLKLKEETEMNKEFGLDDESYYKLKEHENA
jgi:hypothetical protein